MEQNSIIEGNKLIAEFMGGVYDGRKYWTFPDGRRLIHSPDYNSQLKYHSSWDWLMPVVDKIERMKFKIDDDGTDALYNYAFLRTFSYDPQYGYMVRFNRFGLHESPSRIEAMWNAVVDFITTYNQKQEDFFQL